MMKALAFAGVVVVAGLAVGVYRAKLGAEETGARIAEVEAAIDQQREAIAVLKAEEAYLSRPERIGAIARDQLGLEPVRPEQFTPADMLSRRIGAAPLVEPAQPAPAAADAVQ